MNSSGSSSASLSFPLLIVDPTLLYPTPFFRTDDNRGLIWTTLTQIKKQEPNNYFPNTIHPSPEESINALQCRLLELLGRQQTEHSFVPPLHSFSLLRISIQHWTFIIISMVTLVTWVRSRQKQKVLMIIRSAIKPSSVSVAASRLARMTMYQERYKYLPPACTLHQSLCKRRSMRIQPRLQHFLFLQGGR